MRARGVIVALLMATSGVSAQQATPPPQQPGAATTTTVPPRPISPEVFSGNWDYNDALSVDAATGRPERAPRSATQRIVGAPAPGAGGAPRPGGGGAAGGSGAAGGGVPGGDGFDQARRAMAAVIAAERRTYVRDLLEVAEKITVRATPAEVTFVDDLSRQRTYPTDGRLQKYQLSAARYEARASWTDTYFRKDIVGANNFKMTETYFISEDGNRLFLIIRLGDPKRPETLAGVNRVYDRIQSQYAGSKDPASSLIGGGPLHPAWLTSFRSRFVARSTRSH